MPLYAFEGIAPTVHPDAFVAPTATLVGDVVIEAGASVWYNAVIRADYSRVTVRTGANVQDGAVVHVTHDGPYTPGGFPCRVGADVTVGHAALLHACTIEDCCLIGMHATILDGAVVRRHGFVGAGALVTPGKVVGEGELWVGNPARCVRRLSDREIEALQYSASHYVELKDTYLAALR